MFAQFTQREVVDHFADMDRKGWVYFRVAKSRAPVAFAQALVDSMGQQPFREKIAQSDDLFANLNYAQDDMMCTLAFGCNPASAQAVTVLKQFVSWAKAQGLRIDFTPGHEDQPQDIRACIGELIGSDKKLWQFWK